MEGFLNRIKGNFFVGGWVGFSLHKRYPYSLYDGKDSSVLAPLPHPVVSLSLG